MSYISIQLPKDFVEKYIDSVVEHSEFGYSSRPEFVKAAVRSFSSEYLEELEK